MAAILVLEYKHHIRPFLEHVFTARGHGGEPADSTAQVRSLLTAGSNHPSLVAVRPPDGSVLNFHQEIIGTSTDKAVFMVGVGKAPDVAGKALDSGA